MKAGLGKNNEVRYHIFIGYGWLTVFQKIRDCTIEVKIATDREERGERGGRGGYRGRGSRGGGYAARTLTAAGAVTKRNGDARGTPEGGKSGDAA